MSKYNVIDLACFVVFNDAVDVKQKKTFDLSMVEKFTETIRINSVADLVSENLKFFRCECNRTLN